MPLSPTELTKLQTGSMILTSWTAKIGDREVSADDWFPVADINQVAQTVNIAINLNYSAEEDPSEPLVITIPFSKIRKIDNSYVS